MTIPNQSPDSTVAGYLQGSAIGALPGQIAPGQPLEDYLQQFVAAIAGLDGTLVRPRWQQEPPNLPDFGVDWAAVGITERRPLGPNTAVIHHGEGQGADEIQRHEEFDLLCSFYGPNCADYATNLHDGLAIWQNRSLLRLSGLAFVEAGIHRVLPELVKNRWLDRADKTLTLRRIIRRNYPVLNLASARAKIATDTDSQYAVTVTAEP